MPESPREDATYVAKDNIVHPLDALVTDAARRGASATVQSQLQTKVDAEALAVQARAATQGASGSLKRGK
jgi:hypothetical protein